MKNNTYLYLSDEGVIREEYDNYIVISENYIDTIEAIEKAGRKFVICPGCWKAKKDVDRDEEYLRDVRCTVMKYLYIRLNAYHGLDYSEKEWGLILDVWLDSFLAVIWEKYSRFKMNIGMLESCDVQAITNEYVPLDYADFVSMARESWEFNNNIFNHIIKECHVKNVFQIKNVHSFRYTNHGKKDITYCKLMVFRVAAKIFAAFYGRKVRVLLKSCYFPINFQSKIFFKSFGRILPVEFGYSRIDKKCLKTNIDQRWRRGEISDGLYIDEFTDIAVKLVFRYLPLVYLEDFDQIEKISRKLYGKYLNVNGAFHVCEGITSDEVYKHYLIRLKRANQKARYCGTQHGGNYGVDHNTMIRMELTNNDIFYSWGWKSSAYASSVIPMPMVKTISKKIKREKERNILYVGYTFFKEITDFTEETVFYREHFDGEKKFFENLDKKLKRKMVIRLSQSEFGWHVRERIFAGIDGMVFDDIPDFYESLRRASLVVCSSWSTTIIESLYFELPTIVLKKIDWSLDGAIDDLYAMKAQGLLVETWDELNNALLELVDEKKIEKWWEEKERQDVVKRIKRKYGYSGGNDAEMWEKELFKYV